MTAPAYPPLPGGGQPHPNQPRAGEIVIEGFAGAGGNSEGLRLAGWSGLAVGIEWDRTACLTATAAGHPRVQADVAAFPLDHLCGRVAGVVQTPPCQPWSTTGARLGELDRAAVLERATAFAHGRLPAAVTWHDDRSPLSAEPMRYVHALRPRWVMLEQVPAVLELWQHMASLLTGMGYSVWTGKLHAEEYGVPQTRRRAILIASLDREVTRPTPTHQRFRKGQPQMLELYPRWVSLGEALGWSGDGVVVSNYGTGGDPADRGERSFDEPSATITSKAGRNRVRQVRRARGYDGATRTPDEPSLTILGSDDNGDLRFQFERQANGGTRAADEPSLTITASMDNGNLRIAEGETDRRQTLRESLILQTFPADYPLHGTTEQRWLQCGNAVPPVLAAAVFKQLVSEEALRDVA